MVLNPTLKTLKIDDISHRDSFSKFLIYITWVAKLNISLMPGIVFPVLILNTFLRLQPLIESYVFGILLNSLTQKDINSLSTYALIFLGIRLLSSIANEAGGRIENYGSVVAPYKYKGIFSRIVAKLGVATLENSKISNQIFRLKESYGHIWALTSKLFEFLTLFVSFVISASIVANLNYIAAIAILIIAILRAFVYGKELKEDWRFLFLNTENRRIADGYIGTVSILNTLKEGLMMNKFDYFLEKYEKFSNWFLKDFAKRRLRRFNIGVIFDIALFICYAYVFYFFINKYLDSSILIGEFTFNLSAFVAFTSIIKNMLGMYIAVGEAKERVKDAYEIYHFKVSDVINSQKIEVGANLDIEFKDVSFKYPNSSSLVLKNINFEIKKGEKIAIVGENGAGKTTLISLLLGLYSPTSGVVSVGGVDLPSLDMNTWYEKVGILSQDASGYDYMSVRENITLGDYDHDRYNNVKKKVGITEMVEKYAFKDKQILGPKYENGVAPSGGQWQKIVIARTLYRNTPVIIMDEPTSSLDPVSEYSVFNNLFEDFKSKTVIIISHRFSTVKKADRILVVDNGEIVEQGTHRQLLAQKGKYAKSYELQAESFREDQVAN